MGSIKIIVKLAIKVKINRHRFNKKKVAFQKPSEQFIYLLLFVN